MRYLVSFGVWVILLACTVREKRGYERKLVFPAKVRRAQMSDSEDSISVRELQLVMRFVDESKPLRKGLWPFSRDQFSVIVELSNTSDSAMLIEPFLAAPMGNPAFSIQTADGVSLYSNNLTVVAAKIKQKGKFVLRDLGSFFTKFVHTLLPDEYCALDNPVRKYFGLGKESPGCSRLP